MIRMEMLFGETDTMYSRLLSSKKRVLKRVNCSIALIKKVENKLYNNIAMQMKTMFTQIIKNVNV